MDNLEKLVNRASYIEFINAERCRLLSKKYSDDGLLPSDGKRLDALTKEMRVLVPSVTRGDVEKMKQLSEKSAEFTLFNEKMRKKLDMDY